MGQAIKVPQGEEHLAKTKESNTLKRMSEDERKVYLSKKAKAKKDAETTAEKDKAAIKAKK